VAFGRLQEGSVPLLDTMAIEAHLHPDRQPPFGTWRGKKTACLIRLAEQPFTLWVAHTMPRHERV